MSERQARKARMDAAAASRTAETAPPAGRTGIRTAPVRVTLNIPPELFRQLAHWAEEAAVTLDVPRVPVQDALRAMIRATTADKTAGDVVLVYVKEDITDRRFSGPR
jgi:hypothetical protein